MWGSTHNWAKATEKNIEERYILAKSIDRSILIDPRNTNMTS